MIVFKKSHERESHNLIPVVTKKTKSSSLRLLSPSPGSSAPLHPPPFLSPNHSNPLPNLHIHGLFHSHCLSLSLPLSLPPNRSLNSAAVTAPIQPPYPSQQPFPPPFPSETETNSPAPLTPTSITLRWCQNSHHLLLNYQEENHSPRRPMSLQSNLLAETHP
ncbi:hypothetical protein F2Q69_00010379 [Brassica cretica]|uniref:Uncharacterized protein n=1 Tax=Brassica cretica TaxID=69181 RepID=A0A8S9R4D0_BRACR|nr:hypothetical protein F2Q69_00010379 [Brassica cretica]